VPLGKRWTAGASLNYYKYSTVDLRENYSLEGTGIGTDAGLLFSLTKHITLGATFQPETAITLEQEKGADDLKAQDKEAVVPQKAGAGASFAAGNFALGLGYRHIRKPSTPKAVLEGSPWFSRHSYSAGAEYRLFKGMIPLRLGVNWQRNIDDPVNNTVMNRTYGTGIRIKHVAVDVSYIESVESNDRVTGETEHDMGFSFGYAF
jgi:predicted porin